MLPADQEALHVLRSLIPLTGQQACPAGEEQLHLALPRSSSLLASHPNAAYRRQLTRVRRSYLRSLLNLRTTGRLHQLAGALACSCSLQLPLQRSSAQSLFQLVPWLCRTLEATHMGEMIGAVSPLVKQMR